MPVVWNKPAILRTLIRVAIVLVIAYALHLVLGWAMQGIRGLHAGGAGIRIGLLVVILLVYAVLLAIPFVPGIEVGLAVLAMEGAWIAPFVYLGTVGGLILAYQVGAHLPYRYLHRVLADLGLRGACRLLDRIEPLGEAERIALIRKPLPGFLARITLGWRYLLLALLFNIPGSAMLGGGGGIAFVAGLTRIFDARLTILTIVLAVAPVPLLVWLFEMKALF